MKTRLLPLLLLLALAGFIAGLSHLFSMRFERGDVYPPYSTMRPDPLGCKGLADSFAELPGVSVSRNFRSSAHFGKGPKQLMFLIGTDPGSFTLVEKGDVTGVESWVNRGGRLVVAFTPVSHGPGRGGPFRAKDGKKPEKKDEDTSETFVDLAARWGVTFSYAYTRDAKATPAQGAPVAASTSASWHSALWFDRLDPAWQTVLSGGDRPVLVVRRLGAGSIVLSSDSYLFSNEALRNERHSELLSWIAGPQPREAIFDETHLGVENTPSLAMLARRYGLHWTLLVLAVLALLFVWKNGVSFLPETRPGTSSDLISGQDSAAGLANLLRRNVPQRRLLEVCCQEWRKSEPPGRGNVPAKAERMNTVLQQAQRKPAREQDLRGTYRALCEIAAER